MKKEHVLIYPKIPQFLREFPSKIVQVKAILAKKLNIRRDMLKKGSMFKTLKLEAKTPKKKLLKKTMTKTRKNVLFEFLSVYFL